MAINYNTDIVDVLVVPTYNDNKDVVRKVVWTLTAVDSETGTTAVSNEETLLPYPEGDFKKFSSLTKDTVTEWVLANHCISLDVLQDGLRRQIEAIDTPELVSKTLSK